LRLAVCLYPLLGVFLNGTSSGSWWISWANLRLDIC